MKIYVSGVEAVNDLHQKGFTNDFQLYGNDLLWIQEKIFIRGDEFILEEYHPIFDNQNAQDQLTIFGISAPMHNVKGILVNHYQSYTSTIPQILLSKLNELQFFSERA